MQRTLEGVDVVETEEGEAFGGEEDFVLGEGTTEEVGGCGACLGGGG